MTNILLTIKGTSIDAELNGKITSGTIGLPVQIQYDETWSQLKKTAFFRVGSQVRKKEGVLNKTEVPWEVLRNHGKTLEIGLKGIDNDGNIVMPTIWSSIGFVYEGANGQIPAAPNPDREDTPGGGVGEDGTTFYPAVSADGIISWTNDGGKQNPEPVDLTAAVIAALPVYDGEVEQV